MAKTALILGASGKVDTHAARALESTGWSIRRYDRKTDDMTQAAIGADIIVNGLNPPNYHNWSEIIPAITEQVIAAAKASGASVIIPGNVYHFGATGGEWSESTPPNPCSRKGKIRLDMERAYRDSGVQTIILRAGNWIDPEHNSDIFSVLALRSIKSGKITVPGDPDTIQSHAFLPDWARALQMLAEKREQLSQFEDIPFPGHAFTFNELKTALEHELMRPLALSRFPWWALRLTTPVWELARELVEMRYLWNTPHTLSPTRFNALLPDFAPTPMREVMLAALPADIHPDKPMSAGLAHQFSA